MCQSNSKRIHQHSVKCYRVYSEYTGKAKGYYNGFSLPPAGVPTKCQSDLDGPKPFHALRSKKDVKRWNEVQGSYYGHHYYNTTLSIYECILSSKLKGGTWSDSNNLTPVVKTCTGEVLTVVKKVGKIVIPPSDIKGIFPITWNE